MRKIILLVLTAFLFSSFFVFPVTATTCGDSDCNAAWITLLEERPEELVYNGTTYSLELVSIGISGSAYTAGVDINGELYEMIEGNETILPDGRKATVWNVFMSVSESIPSATKIQIGDETMVSCSDCENPSESTKICGDGVCDSSNVTLVSGQTIEVIYDSVVYNLKLITVDLEESKAAVQINDDIFILNENVENTVSNNLKAVIWDLLEGATGPDSLKIQLGDETHISCDDCPDPTEEPELICGNGNCDCVNKILTQGEDTDIVYNSVSYSVLLVSIDLDNSKAIIEFDNILYEMFDEQEEELHNGLKSTVNDLFVGAKESTPNSLRFYLGNETFVSCSDCEKRANRNIMEDDVSDQEDGETSPTINLTSEDKTVNVTLEKITTSKEKQNLTLSIDKENVTKTTENIIEVKEAVTESLNGYEEEEDQRGVGYGVSWFFGLAANQEKSDADFLRAQVEVLNNTAQVLLQLADQIDDTTIKLILREQSQLLQEQAESLLVRAEEKEARALGLWSYFGAR